MKSHILYTAAAALYATAASARHLVESKPTGIVNLALDGMTPKPTSPPDYHNLFRRQKPEDQYVIVAPDATCGYISGRPGASYTCGPGATCAFLSIKSDDGYVACCNSEECGFRATCVDYDDFFTSSSCTGGCEVDILTLKCTATSAPFCNTISFAGGIQDFWCNNVNISTYQVASTSYSGQPEDRIFQTFPYTDLTAEITIASSGTEDSLAATGNPTADSTSDTTTSTTASETSATETSEPSSGTPIGAIVGGVVGGVGALALAGLAAFFILRRKKQKKATDAAAAAGNPQNFQQPMQQQPGVGPGGYNPVPQGAAGYYDPKSGYPPSVQQYGQPGVAYYPTQHGTPDPNYPTNPSSPATTMADPRMSHMATSPSPSYAPGPMPGQQQPGYQQGYAQGYPQGHPQGHPQGQQPQQNVIHEADSEPNKQIQPSELA